VTSACYSPRLAKNIDFAMLPIAYTELGTELEVETPHSGRVEDVVVRKPFIDREKEVPRQQGHGAHGSEDDIADVTAIRVDGAG
jgi:glycine cleavage system aminomethyltransferase T